MSHSLAIATLSHRPDILDANLKRSPCIADGSVPLSVIPDAASASSGNNRALDAAGANGADVVVLAHHDVYLPLGWDALLRARIAEVAALDPDWGLIGAYGNAMTAQGDVPQGHGPVWSSSLSSIIGRMALTPLPALGYDELLLVVRRASGLRFDETLPGFHLWATDMATQARAGGIGAWQTALPLVHNDAFHEGLDASFAAAYQHLRAKWHDRLPLYSPMITLTRSRLTLARWNWRNRRSKDWRKALATSPDALDPAAVARRCGWADLRPAT